VRHPGQALSLAVIGFGKLGRVCGEIVLRNDALRLAGIVRRAESLHKPLRNDFKGVPATSSIATLGAIDVALLCLPARMIGAAAYELLQHRIPIVECGDHSADDFQSQRARLHHVALRHGVAAIWGAGWNPGALSLFRRLFTLLIPKGHTETKDRPGVSLHHMLRTAAINEVRDALCTEVISAEGKAQRYVYVELAPGAEAERVATLIRSDPQFLDAETLVFPVDSVAALEQQGHGIVLARRGSTATADHQMLMLESRFDIAALAGQVMIAAARALRWLPPGLHALSELPLNFLCPEGIQI
jgi:diaminopimelate dehydrogenase